MRVKSGLWVAAYVRRLGSIPVAAMVMKRGDADAGAIFIKVNRLDGRACVLRPALSMGSGDADGLSERRWVEALQGGETPESEADAYLARQREFDADLWVIEVEDREGRHFLNDFIAKE
jgi:hypothetical protein